jgi:hypothetical protein
MRLGQQNENKEVQDLGRMRMGGEGRLVVVTDGSELKWK